MPDDTNPPTTQQSALVIPEDIAAKFAELLDLIKGSESMNNEERQYWINILPIMTPEQIQNLHDILLNERTQLQAIDQKYASEIQNIGQPATIKQTEEVIQQRRTERVQKEESVKQKEEEDTQSILEKIESV